MRLPPEIVKELDDLWKRSTATNQEQGGNIVRTYGGAYDIRVGGHYSDESTWDPNSDDVGVGQQYIGLAHTHPYQDFAHGTFSPDDLINVADYDQKISLVRSGPMTFMVARTKEFEAMLAQVEKEPDSRKLVERREAFKHQMREVFEAAFTAHKGPFPEQLEAGVLAVCDRYHLIYYAGQGGALERKSKRGRR